MGSAARRNPRSSLGLTGPEIGSRARWSRALFSAQAALHRACPTGRLP